MLDEREAARGDRRKGQARGQRERVLHDPDIDYALRLDTARESSVCWAPRSDRYSNVTATCARSSLVRPDSTVCFDESSTIATRCPVASASA